MKSILGIIGSPRKLGNCEIMVKEISRNITEPHELQLLRLNDFDIRPCRGCYACLFKTGRCVMQDDFHTVLAAITAADALILAAPAYLLGVNAALKRFIDRGLAFYAHLDKLWNKPSVGVGIAGIPGKEGHTLLGIENFLAMVLSQPKMKTIAYGALPGEVFMAEQNKTLAGQLGQALFTEPQPVTAPACPLCGGQTFRFLDNQQVRCMLCSNAGTIVWQDGAPQVDIVADDHPMFLTKQNVVDHKNWLLGMKSRFLENKKPLKAITIEYLKEGHWLKPETDRQ